MLDKLISKEYLNRDELYSCIYEIYEESNDVKVYRHLTDYYGNYDEIYNEYLVLNTKEVEQLLVDYFMDNVLLDGTKNVEHIFYVPKEITTYLKYNALKAYVFEHLNQKVYAVDVQGDYDFIIFDDSTLLLLDFTNEGALKGGYISTNSDDIKFALNLFNEYKSGAVDYLKRVPCESSIKNNINKKIKEIKYNLKIK